MRVRDFRVHKVWTQVRIIQQMGCLTFPNSVVINCRQDPNSADHSTLLATGLSH